MYLWCVKVNCEYKGSAVVVYAFLESCSSVIVVFEYNGSKVYVYGVE
jgi:hypothetical protein